MTSRSTLSLLFSHFQPAQLRRVHFSMALRENLGGLVSQGPEPSKTYHKPHARRYLLIRRFSNQTDENRLC